MTWESIYLSYLHNQWMNLTLINNSFWLAYMTLNQLLFFFLWGGGRRAGNLFKCSGDPELWIWIPTISLSDNTPGHSEVPQKQDTGFCNFGFGRMTHPQWRPWQWAAQKHSWTGNFSRPPSWCSALSSWPKVCVCGLLAGISPSCPPSWALLHCFWSCFIFLGIPWPCTAVSWNCPQKVKSPLRC